MVLWSVEKNTGTTVTDQSLQFPRFFVTAPAQCPYLPKRQERKVFTELRGDDAGALNEALSRVGFRRSQSVAYRPACEGCSACISVRIVAQDYKPPKTMRRILSRNKDILPSFKEPKVTDEQYDLLKRYLGARHADGGMADMSFLEYAEMVQHSPVNTSIIEYRLPPSEDQALGKLVACCLSDVMGDGLSMVYSFYDPEFASQSLGTHIILHHIEEATKRGLHYVYLGYWIKGSDKMNYKIRFQPLERLSTNGWVPLTAREAEVNTQGDLFL